ncbi:MAG: histidine kinase dimerization/phospho-acceptor domain-containing protein [Gaiellaceae bacterium]
MPEDARFAQLVTLACHDLRTPLATVYGFARTLGQTGLEAAPARYVEMIEAASGQMGELLDELGLVTRIELGRYDPILAEIDSLELARAAAERLGEQRVEVEGEGATVRVDVDATTRALARLAQAAARHSGVDSVRLAVKGAELEISPVGRAAGPVLLGEELRELGAAAAAAVLRKLGAELSVADERLTIRLPQ